MGKLSSAFKKPVPRSKKILARAAYEIIFKINGGKKNENKKYK